MKLKNIFRLIFLTFFALISCGRKGALEKPTDYKRPNFDNVIEER